MSLVVKTINAQTLSRGDVMNQDISEDQSDMEFGRHSIEAHSHSKDIERYKAIVQETNAGFFT
jgi:hypothetical protein